MSPEIRFNAYGIPYLVEFANVSFRSRSVSRSRSTITTESTADTQSVRTVRSKASLFSRRRREDFDTHPSLRLRPAHFLPPRLFPSRLRPAPSSSSSCDSDWTLASASSSTETLAAAAPDVMKTLPPEPKIEIESEIECEGTGLLIRFASSLPAHARAQTPRKLSEHRLARLKYRIAKAVTAAGMDSSPATERDDPMDKVAGMDKDRDSAARGSCAGRDYDYRASVCSIRSEEVVQRGLPSSLFRGTYGQVMSALAAAGLTTEHCSESGVQDATRLGALFVAHQSACGGVEFTRLTLWA